MITPVVAVDCNGADMGPAEVAAGAMLAVTEGARVLLFGPVGEMEIPHPLPEHVDVVDAPVSIAKSADPVSAVRATPEASIVQAARAIAQGRAQALVCAGGTGAALAAGLFNVKRARGIYRPALAVPLPIPGSPLARQPARPGGHSVILLDVGANAEARREHLVQFAFMGAALASAVLGVERPRVGLLSNGEESARGGRLIVETGEELTARAEQSDALQFIGNVEGSDVVSGVADVIVTDGLTGNIALKLMEGVSQALLGAVRDAAMASTRAKLGGALLRPALREVRDELDPEEHGGAYLLGLRSLGVVPHGRFTRRGFAQAILRAQRGASEDLVGRTQIALEQAGALRSRVSGPSSAPAASLPQAR